MKIKIISSTLLILSATSHALTLDEKKEAQKKDEEILAKMGLPLPGSGIKIVPRTMLDLSSEELAEGDKEMAEFREKGYVSKYINRPRELLSVSSALVRKELKSSSTTKNEHDTGLSADVNQMKLAFTFPSLI